MNNQTGWYQDEQGRKIHAYGSRISEETMREIADVIDQMELEGAKKREKDTEREDKDGGL